MQFQENTISSESFQSDYSGGAKELPFRKSAHTHTYTLSYYKHLVSKKEFVLSKQLLRSSTSIGANIRESRNAQSTKDFIHKLSISQKECDESIYWLELLKETNYINDPVFSLMKNNATEILLMLKSSIITAKNNMNK